VRNPLTFVTAEARKTTVRIPPTRRINPRSPAVNAAGNSPRMTARPTNAITIPTIAVFDCRRPFVPEIDSAIITTSCLKTGTGPE
jgi:hypothetical protein